MYKQTMHKIRKALNRINRIRIENHFRKYIAKISGYIHIRTPYTWSGLTRPSVFLRVHKQISSPGKYIPHQAAQECTRRSNG